MGAETAGECAIALPAIRQATIERAAQMEIDLHCYKCGSELDGYPSAARGGGAIIRVYPCDQCAATGVAVDKPAPHIGSPKLPEWKDLWAALPPAPADWGCDIPTAVEIYRYGAQSAYDFIARKLRVGD